jgi:hypothetical protein
MASRTVRILAAAAAAASALLYYLIGFGVLYIGESTTGEDAGLLGFGLMAGSTFLVAALLVWLMPRRWLLALVALLDVAVIVGYFAAAGIRDPSFEPWGLLVKAAQVVFLLALGYLLLQAPGSRPYGRTVR